MFGRNVPNFMDEKNRPQNVNDSANKYERFGQINYIAAEMSLQNWRLFSAIMLAAAIVTNVLLTICDVIVSSLSWVFSASVSGYHSLHFCHDKWAPPEWALIPLLSSINFTKAPKVPYIKTLLGDIEQATTVSTAAVPQPLNNNANTYELNGINFQTQRQRVGLPRVTVTIRTALKSSHTLFAR